MQSGARERDGAALLPLRGRIDGIIRMIMILKPSSSRKQWMLPAHHDGEKGTVMIRFQRTLFIEQWQVSGAHKGEMGNVLDVCKKIEHIRHDLDIEPRRLTDITGMTFHDGDSLIFELEDPGAYRIGVMIFAREASANLPLRDRVGALPEQLGDT